MKEGILNKFRSLWQDKNLRQKLLITFGLFLIFRFLAFVPVPAIDIPKLRELVTSNQFFALLDIFSGGTVFNFSVIALGLGPYINASIIIQLLTVMLPQLEALAKEGDYGRAKINQYTRFLTLPISILQAIGIYVYLQNQNIISSLNFVEFLGFVVTMVAGTYITVWIGELISEYGLGNGISLLIFVGIIARAPVVFARTFMTIDQEMIITSLILLGLSLAVVYAVVFINEAVRRVPVYYAKRIRGNKMLQGANSYLPLKLNQAGVIPIIFAISFVLFPQLIGNFLQYSKVPVVATIAKFLATTFSSQGIVYNIFYFLLVFGFTFFYTIVVFNPDKIADEIQKNGGFIPGIRPGASTKKYLQSIVYKITTFGALFLGVIAILPSIASSFSGIQGIMIGGTGILIVVSVVLETFKLIESQLAMKKYDTFM